MTKEIQTNQSHLVDVLKVLFPNDEVVLESRKQTQLKYATGGYVEFDIWVPHINLSFEFQDAYHYTDTWYSHKQLNDVQHSDGFKRNSARAIGMTLIDIPCWWDGSIERLVASIQFYRPDIHLEVPKTEVISLNPPESLFTIANIPDVGELMLASFPISNSVPDSVNGWWVGEKYDGIRCCWNPVQRKIFTRSGKTCELNSSIYFHLPAISLDAELWTGRENFGTVQNLVSGADPSFFKWHHLRVNAFDVPSINLQSRPFEERYLHLLSNMSIDSPVLINAPRMGSNSSYHVSRMMHSVIVASGEGVILRLQGSLYERGRSHSLLKIKGYHGDQEAIVIQVASDKTVTLKLLNGQMFSVSPQNVLVPCVVPGDVVSFSFENFAKKSDFVNPTIIRIRTDMPWSEAIYNSHSESNSVQKEGKEGRERKHARRYWTENAMREVFEKLATSRNMDPLLAETWFHISHSDVEQVEGGKTILQHFKGFVAALQHLFPSIEHTIPELSQFHNQNKWSELVNRRAFFEKIASDMAFDPLIPENWYNVNKEKIVAFKGASTVLRYYNNNLTRALVSVFPDIGLNRAKLYYGTQADYRKRKFFEDYAKENKFDAQIPENWYSQSMSRIKAAKGSKSVLHSFNGSVPAALVNIFPDIGLDKALFEKWKITHEQRRFFERLADRNSFHPYSAENWYSLSRETILAAKGAHAILRHYEGSVAKALVNIFPDIGLEQSKFSKKTFRNHIKM